MHDYVATFYGGYDQVDLRRLPRRHISWIVAAIGVAAVVLLALVAADVSAFEARPPVVTVTSVGWYAEGYLLTTSAGFAVHVTETVSFPLTCDSVCLPWVGATVSAPFELVGFAVVYHTVQYTNLTVRAPSSAYHGPLAITLLLG